MFRTVYEFDDTAYISRFTKPHKYPNSNKKIFFMYTFLGSFRDFQQEWPRQTTITKHSYILTCIRIVTQVNWYTSSNSLKRGQWINIQVFQTPCGFDKNVTNFNQNKPKAQTNLMNILQVVCSSHQQDCRRSLNNLADGFPAQRASNMERTLIMVFHPQSHWFIWHSYLNHFPKQKRKSDVSFRSWI